AGGTREMVKPLVTSAPFTFTVMSIGIPGSGSQPGWSTPPCLMVRVTAEGDLTVYGKGPSGAPGVATGKMSASATPTVSRFPPKTAIRMPIAPCVLISSSPVFPVACAGPLRFRDPIGRISGTPDELLDQGGLAEHEGRGRLRDLALRKVRLHGRNERVAVV